MITTVIFDLWNTLGKKNASFSTALRKHFSLDLSGENYALFESSIQLNKWESMEDMAKAFLQAFSLEENKENISFVVKAQENVLSLATPFEGTRRLISKLDGLTTAVLSNATIFEASIIKKWGFDELFDNQIFSFDTGLLKPSKESFHKACTLLSVKPNECLFIDDNEQNCANAQAIGMRTIHFSDNAALRVELKELLNAQE